MKKEKSKHEDKIEKILAMLDNDDSAMIPPGATREDIAQCQQELLDVALEPLPQGYINFLKRRNGLAWNGVVFYSTCIIKEADNPHSFILNDLVSENDDFNDRYELDEKVLLGRMDEDYFTYNIETKKYEILALEDREMWEQFDTFEDLFYYVIGGRLGLLAGTDEAKYEHEEGKYDGEV